MLRVEEEFGFRFGAQSFVKATLNVGTILACIILEPPLLPICPKDLCLPSQPNLASLKSRLFMLLVLAESQELECFVLLPLHLDRSVLMPIRVYWMDPHCSSLIAQRSIRSIQPANNTRLVATADLSSTRAPSIANGATINNLAESPSQSRQARDTILWDRRCRRMKIVPLRRPVEGTKSSMAPLK